MDYNTERSHLILKEYGRHVQDLVAYISTIEDREKRTAYAHTLIHLMKMLNPSVKDNDDPQRIWDHLFVMSDFQLDIDGPYPIPDPEVIFRKPEPLEYRTEEVRFRNYGRNIELLVEKGLALEDEQERISAFVQIGRLVKSFYSSWHKDSVEDAVIISQLKELSNNQVDLTEVWEASNQTIFNTSGGNSRSNTQEQSHTQHQQPQHHQNKSNKGGHHHHRGRKRNHRRKH